MYEIKLEKYDSRKEFPDKRFLSENTETLSDEAIFYSAHRDVDSKGIANLGQRHGRLKTGHVLPRGLMYSM